MIPSAALSETKSGDAVRELRVWLRLRWRVSLLALVAAAPAAALPAGAPTPGYATRPDVQAFIAELVATEAFDAAALRRLFAQVRVQPKVIAAMSRPLLVPPKWYEYFPQFLSQARVDAGVAFWRDNETALTRAQVEFGVPAEVIVAIIGVETFYGRNTGSYRVIDALSTLAFDYPRRAEYFRGELKQFLLLAREQGVSPLEPKGSFAGAAGLPQFMPGSIRAYAVDYDGDGRIDLADNVIDAIGSVANYLAQHGWQPDQPVMQALRLDAETRDAVQHLFDGGTTERRSIAAWVRDGIVGFVIPGDLSADPVGLLMLEVPAEASYWMVFNNWYVLTRYNRSRLYASAVWQLAQAVNAARAGEQRGLLIPAADVGIVCRPPCVDSPRAIPTHRVGPLATGSRR
jgi:membrane-bound lytic murein transglycosylase B